MNSYFQIIFALFCIFTCKLNALYRDYNAICDRKEMHPEYYQTYCLDHTPLAPDWIPNNRKKIIPTLKAKCSKCNRSSIYLGYFDPDFRKFRGHFLAYLEYCHKNSSCRCYWPERTTEAAKISDSAYLLFKDLIKTTALSDLLKNEEDQKKFIENPVWFLNLHGLTVSLIAHQFLFSDYYHTSKVIECYAASKYNDRQLARIKDKLESILDTLYPKFLSLYKACYKRHPYKLIEQELVFMKLLVNDLSVLISSVDSEKINGDGGWSIDEDAKLQLTIPELIHNCNEDTAFHQEVNQHFQKEETLTELGDFNCGTVRKAERKADAPIFFPIDSEIMLELGSVLNDLLLHKQAIDTLTQAIKYNCNNREAYIERALAYFETNQINLALKDYEKAKEIDQRENFLFLHVKCGPYIPKQKMEFAKGLIKGIILGSQVTAENFVPDTITCFRGILHGLWAFALSPYETSREMINAAYAIGEFLNDHDTLECLECLVPELKDLSKTWHKIDDYLRGKKIGFMIGRYGLEIFASSGVIKAVSKLRALKRANTMCSLEACALSNKQKNIILEKSSLFASQKKEAIKNAVKNGNIFIRTENTIHHVMQKKHRWEKVLTLTGNKKEDFKTLLNFLQKEDVISKKYILKTQIVRENIRLIEYKKIIRDHEVRVFVNEYIDTGKVFLNNGWVVKK